MAYRNSTGDVIALDNPKAGAMVMSQPLSQITGESNADPIEQFARRDAFRTVAEFIAESIAAVPFNLYRRDEGNGRQKLQAGEHPLAAALSAPVPGGTQYRLIEALMLDSVLHDRWAVLLNYSSSGALQLIRLPGRFISFAIDHFGIKTHVILRNRAGGELPIPIQNVLFDVGYDPFATEGKTSGFGIAHTMAAAATELDKGAKYREALLDNGPKVPMYVSRPKEAGDWGRNGGFERFRDSFAGFSAERAGQVPILEDGMTLEAAPQLGGDAVGYRETRLSAQIEYAIAMHVPPELIGYRAGNFSNIEALREQLYNDVLQPRIKALREAVNASARNAGIIDDSLYVEENLAARLASSPEKQASIMQTQVGAPILTVNEARQRVNLPPVEGGDELIVPLNVVRGGLASPTDTAPKTLGRGKARVLRTMKGHDGPRQRARLADDLAAFFGRQAARVTAVLGDGSSPGSLPDAFKTDLEQQDLFGVIYPHAVQFAMGGAAGVLDVYDPAGDSFSEEALLPWLSKAAKGWTDSINIGTERQLAQLVVADDWRAGVDEYFQLRASSGAHLWSLSIDTTSTSFGALDAARAVGLGLKVWTSGEAKHAALDGAQVALDELFVNGARYPGDPRLEVPDKAGCSCSISFLPATD
jgi:HK97 family phage portal protein